MLLTLCVLLSDRVVCALWSGHRSAAARFWYRVLLAVRVVCTVWSDAVALRVLLQVLPKGDV